MYPSLRAARWVASETARLRASVRIVSRCRCSMTTVTRPITESCTSTMTVINFARRLPHSSSHQERSCCKQAPCIASPHSLTALGLCLCLVGCLLLQPEFLHGDIMGPQGIDFDALHVWLIQVFKDLMVL